VWGEPGERERGNWGVEGDRVCWDSGVTEWRLQKANPVIVRREERIVRKPPMTASCPTCQL
jgi:hypothetical protein